MKRLSTRWSLTIAYTIVVLTVVLAAFLYTRNNEEHHDLAQATCRLAKENAIVIRKISDDVAATLDPINDRDTIVVLHNAAKRSLVLIKFVGDCTK